MLSGNSATYGGGIFNKYSLTVTNSTIAANAANADGGGIYNAAAGVANSYNTSIVYNVADADADPSGGRAGGVYSLGTFNMRNTLIAGNSVSGIPVYDDCGGTLRSYGWDLITALGTQTSGSCSIVSVEGNRSSLNDLGLLGLFQDNGGPTKTVALLPGSNAIDGGDPAFGCTDVNGAVVATDQRGITRPKGVRCDVGAYEYYPETDTDGDGLADELDNCRLVSNVSQLDTNGDGYGNLCDPDFNNNGIVDSQDGALLKAAFGSTGFPDRDLNGNGIVDSNDGARLKARFGQAPGPSGLHP